jgi:putative tricarboxylic transport membrane protein
MAQFTLQRALAGSVAAFGGFVVYVALQIDNAGSGYSGVGPRVAPLVIGVLICLAALGLLVQSFTGGFRNLDDETNGEPFAPVAFVWVLAGLVAQMAAIETLGFVIATTTLFWCCARGFGSRTALRDAVYAVGIALVVYLVFTKGLGVNLTKGLMPF